MIIRYPESLKDELKIKGKRRGKDSQKGYREILEELDEEYVLNLVSRKKIDSNYYRKILNDIDKQYIEEMS